jgi:alpha-N-arabinofuranosidase
VFAASFSLDPDFTVAPVNRRTFGSFVEHLGRCVYGGIVDPGHPASTAEGFRQDVIDLVREMGVSVVRYPGGNFVSGYRWEDGVGPVAERPVRLDAAWRSIESNQVGLGEFARWARLAGVETMLAVNLGTRGVQEALDLLEYANHPGGTRLSDLRRSHGAEEPFDIRMWCLGNEMDGPWQTGHKTSREYGRLAAETGRAMRMLDPGLELVACGSSNSGMPTFGAWEAEVLELSLDQVDHVSAHAYYELTDGDLGSFLASAVDMDYMIDSVVATADATAARLNSRKKVMVSFDEWNVWYQSRLSECIPEDWTVAPRISEDAYNVTDAVVVGSLLISLLRHNDRVSAACQAQLVNAIAPIRAEPSGPAWRQSTFHPFALTSRLARGEVLQTQLRSPRYDSAKYGEVGTLDAVATHDRRSGEVAVFVINRHQHEPADLTVALRAFAPGLRVVEAWTLSDEDPAAVNTRTAPDRVVPHPADSAVVTDGSLRIQLPPISWTAVRLAPPTLPGSCTT